MDNRKGVCYIKAKDQAYGMVLERIKLKAGGRHKGRTWEEGVKNLKQERLYCNVRCSLQQPPPEYFSPSTPKSNTIHGAGEHSKTELKPAALLFFPTNLTFPAGAPRGPVMKRRSQDNTCNMANSHHLHRK